MSRAASTTPSPVLAWGAASRAIPGERESGDQLLIAPFPGGALAAVIDGLGHGTEAAEAARSAVASLATDADRHVTALVERCHADLRNTRGAVMSLASFRVSDNSMTWLAVGNVEGFLFHADRGSKTARDALLLRGGVVGYQLPPLRPAVLPVARGDTLIFATDGISGRFSDASPIGCDPQAVAEDILARYGKHTDDALVLVIRYLGAEP